MNDKGNFYKEIIKTDLQLIAIYIPATGTQKFCRPGILLAGGAIPTNIIVFFERKENYTVSNAPNYCRSKAVFMLNQTSSLAMFFNMNYLFTNIISVDTAAPPQNYLQPINGNKCGRCQ